MTMNGWSRFYSVYCLVLVVLLQAAHIHGQKNSKGTSSPKAKGASPNPTRTFQPVAPSFLPSSTVKPFAPSSLLTAGPSSILLTSPPTAAPTDAPSTLPSSGPSVIIARPSFSPKGANGLTPTSLPTIKVHSSKPTETSVKQPPNAALTAVALPLLGITFEVNIQQNDLSASRLQQIFSSWLSGYLVTDAVFGPFLDHVDLQVVEMLQSPVRRQLQQLGSIVVHVNVVFRGSVYFSTASAGEKIPTPANLVNTLDIFFSEQSGVQALQDVLSSIVTLDTTHGVQVSINGVLVSKPSAAQSAALSSTNPAAQNSSPGKQSSLRLYLGLGIGVVALTMALLLVFWLRGKRLAKSTSRRSGTRFYVARRREGSKRLATAAAVQQARIGASPREQAVVAAVSDDCSVQSAVSFDSSMYTNNADVPYRPSVPQSPGSYDVKRLERVIRSAKEIAKELSDDESSLYLRSI